MDLVSTCCSSPVQVAGKDSDPFGTRWYMCVACCKPCDVREKTMEGISTCDKCTRFSPVADLTEVTVANTDTTEKWCRYCVGRAAEEQKSPATDAAGEGD